MTELKRIWGDQYTIHSYESDMSARATVVALLQYMQESAWNHAEHLQLGFSHLSPKGLAWVLARLSLKITQLPHWHQSINLETWPSGRDKLFAYRDFRISTGDGEPLAIGSTTWLVIDIKRRRPQRTDSYFQMEQWQAERVFPEFTGKVPPLERADAVSSRHVYFSHLDVNGHVNNVKYLDYVVDSFGHDFLVKHHLKSLEMNFLAEALYGDVIDIKTQQTGDLGYLHSLQHQVKGDELCRLATTWAKD